MHDEPRSRWDVIKIVAASAAISAVLTAVIVYLAIRLG
jgi:hypothetical protein